MVTTSSHMTTIFSSTISVCSVKNISFYHQCWVMYLVVMLSHLHKLPTFLLVLFERITISQVILLSYYSALCQQHWHSNLNLSPNMCSYSALCQYLQHSNRNLPPNMCSYLLREADLLLQVMVFGMPCLQKQLLTVHVNFLQCLQLSKSLK